MAMWDSWGDGGGEVAVKSARDASGEDQTSSEEKALQQRQLEETIGLLLGAGYFRARLPQLPAFDKVVGGLCWCISSSGESVDVDIFYDEDLALGQKIRIAENVVVALRQMRCPAPLQANQIQGGDYAKVFPVVQFLVRKVLENRAATGDYARVASETHFAKHYRGRVGVGEGAGAVEALVGGRYRVGRQLRRGEALWEADAGLGVAARVQACLLEYGERLAAGAKVEVEEEGAGASDLDRRMAAMRKKQREEEARRAKQAAELEAEMMGQMRSGSAGKVSGAKVGSLLGLGGASLRAAAASFARREEELRAEAESGSLVAGTRLGKAQAHRRRVARLRARVEAAGLEKQAAQEALRSVLAELEGAELALRKAEEYKQRARREMRKLDEAARASGKYDQWMQLRRLLATLETMTQQERAFKAHCRRCLVDLQARVKAARLLATQRVDAGRLEEAQRVHDEAAAKHKRLRAMLARRGREAARFARLVDDIPSRTELGQYRRRFEELFDSSASKTHETRRYYATFNALQKKKEYLSKETKLVQSMHAQLQEAVRSRAVAEAYLQQCDAIIRAVQSTVAKQRSALAEKTAQRDDAAAKVQALNDEERSYFRALKLLRAEAEKADELASRAEERGIRLE